VQGGFAFAVEVAPVFARARTEPNEVEVRVARFQRIEAPVPAPHATLEQCDALVPLQRFAQPLVLEFRSHRQHVRPVHHRAFFHARNAEHETNHAATVVEGSGRNAADFLREAKHRPGHELVVIRAPRVLLQLKAGVEICRSLQIADGDTLDDHSCSSKSE
jgi:hypothetical protein